MAGEMFTADSTAWVPITPTLFIISPDLCATCDAAAVQTNEEYREAVDRFNHSLSHKGDFPPVTWATVIMGAEAVMKQYAKRCGHDG